MAASGDHSSSRCAGLSLPRPLLLWSTGPRRAGSVVVAHGPSCSVACGIFPDQGSNPCPLHWQADSQPLRHQESPHNFNRFFSLNHLKVSYRYRDSSPLKIDFFLHNHNTISTSLKLNINSISFNIQSVFKFPQLS